MQEHQFVVNDAAESAGVVPLDEKTDVWQMYVHHHRIPVRILLTTTLVVQYFTHYSAMVSSPLSAKGHIALSRNLTQLYLSPAT